MGMEAFAKVFTKSADEVEELYKKHQKNADSYAVMAIFLGFSIALCIWLMVKCVAIPAGTLMAVVFGGVLLLIALFVGCCIAAVRSKIKAVRLYTDLRDSYIMDPASSRTLTEYYQ